MKHIGTYLQLGLGIGAYVLLRSFGVLTGWPNIPLPIGSIPVSGDSVQVLIAAAAAFLPNVFERLFSVAWVEDAVAMPGRVKELHAVKGVLVTGAVAADGLAHTSTVVPAVAEKPPA